MATSTTVDSADGAVTTDDVKRNGERKVLLAVDLSAWSEQAFDWYVRHIHEPNSDVICFHLAEMPHISAVEAYGIAADAYKEAIEGCKDTAKRIQEKFILKMKEHNMHGRVIVKFGSFPGEAITQIGASEQVAMVVMGTRGLGTIRRTILGSVSDYVLHHAHCPVVICSHEQLHPSVHHH